MEPLAHLNCWLLNALILLGSAGEFYFDENKLELALDRYRNILRFPESRWFDKALYKMGWTYYRLSDTKKAISAFFYLINEQDELSEGGLDIELFSPTIRDFAQKEIDKPVSNFIL